MEVQYDPSTGESNFVNRGHMMANNDPTTDGPSPEEIQEHRLQQQAANYSRSRGQTAQATAGDSDNLEKEVELAELQQAIFAETDSLRRDVLLMKAEAIASALVGAVENVTATPEETVANASEEFEENLKNTNPDVEADLQFASECMDETLLTEYNDEILGSDDLVVKQSGYQLLSDLRQNPQYFGNRNDMEALTPAHTAALEDLVGSSLANDIVTCSEVIRSGKVSSASVIKTVMQNESLSRAFRAAAEAGIIQIAL